MLLHGRVGSGRRWRRRRPLRRWRRSWKPRASTSPSPSASRPACAGRWPGSDRGRRARATWPRTLGGAAAGRARGGDRPPLSRCRPCRTARGPPALGGQDSRPAPPLSAQPASGRQDARQGASAGRLVTRSRLRFLTASLRLSLSCSRSRKSGNGTCRQRQPLPRGKSCLHGGLTARPAACVQRPTGAALAQWAWGGAQGECARPLVTALTLVCAIAAHRRVPAPATGGAGRVRRQLRRRGVRAPSAQGPLLAWGRGGGGRRWSGCQVLGWQAPVRAAERIAEVCQRRPVPDARVAR